MCTMELWKLWFLSAQVLEELKTNVSQTIVIKFETLLSLGWILVVLIMDIL